MKTILINAVAGCLILFIGASVHGSYTYTTLDVPGASQTLAYGIDGGNIAEYYSDGSGTHGFSYDGTTYTTLDVPGTNYTRAYGIDDGNIVGRYYDGSGNSHGFRATLGGGTAVPLPASAWMALPLLGVMCVIGKMRRRQCA